MSSSERLFFSVIIITRNRAATIPPTLTALRTIDYPPEKFEVIVVDNGSTDNTPEVVPVTLQTAKFQWKIVHEPVKGLCSARNSGLIEAKGEWVVYLDDDALPITSWLTAYENATKSYPSAVAMGGPVELAPDTKRPWWWCSRFEWSMSCQDYGDNLRVYPKYAHPYGLNMAIRRSTLLEQDGFDARMDEIGSNLGDETEFFLRLLKSNHELVYVPDTLVVHCLPSDRLHWNSFKQRCRQVGCSHACLEYVHNINLQARPWRMFLNAIYNTLECPSPVHFIIAWHQWHGYRSFRPSFELADKPRLVTH